MDREATVLGVGCGHASGVGVDDRGDKGDGRAQVYCVMQGEVAVLVSDGGEARLQ